MSSNVVLGFAQFTVGGPGGEGVELRVGDGVRADLHAVLLQLVACVSVIIGAGGSRLRGPGVMAPVVR